MNLESTLKKQEKAPIAISQYIKHDGLVDSFACLLGLYRTFTDV